MTEAPDSHSPETLRAEFAAHGQGHVFRFWDVLDADARRRLVRQASSLELPALLGGYAGDRASHSQPCANM